MLSWATKLDGNMLTAVNPDQHNATEILCNDLKIGCCNFRVLEVPKVKYSILVE